MEQKPPPERIWIFPDKWEPEMSTTDTSGIEYVRADLVRAPNARKCACGHNAEDHARGQMRRFEPCEVPNCECVDYDEKMH
jgi:hypothetical protein